MVKSIWWVSKYGIYKKEPHADYKATKVTIWCEKEPAVFPIPAHQFVGKGEAVELYMDGGTPHLNLHPASVMGVSIPEVLLQHQG